jgi:Ankyrin repeats (3 copies)
MGNSVWTKY